MNELEGRDVGLRMPERSRKRRGGAVQVRRDRRKAVVDCSPEPVHNRDNGKRNARRDQTVLDRCGAAVNPSET